MKFNKLYYLFLLLLTAGCNDQEAPYDASGVFETTEVIVSSELNGKLISLDLDEGSVLSRDTPVGQIDTIQLHLKKRQLVASKNAVLSGRPDVQSQIKATEREIAKWQQEKKRVEKLLAGDVATQKQLDDINAQLDILNSKLDAQKSSLNTNVSALESQAETFDVQIEQVNDQLARSVITSPISGTVLTKYAESGEVAGMGKPLFKVGDLENMILRAYVTSDQLASLSLNQKIKVLAEFGESELRQYDGQVTWISSESEFTPKTIQTQDERANLVYAIKVKVRNDGDLKIGMYGGIKLAAE
jgi:HlyD family secretion protein